LWRKEDVGSNRQSKNEMRSLFPDEASFGTPKPERLMQRILHIATKPGDLVLDSFLGSGTTAAVAHKMRLRWIGIEMGDHAIDLCKPRLDKVIAGEQGGVSEAVGWTGGGGYRFYRLGATVFDADGHIADGIAFATLAAHIWFSETGTPFTGAADAPVLGVHDGTAYALLYNGILGDRLVSGGNVLTAALLVRLREASGWDGPMTVYGESSRLGTARLADAGVTFKQTPYDVKAR
jgi:adenine-specific DNA-methyltransferase